MPALFQKLAIVHVLQFAALVLHRFLALSNAGVVPANLVFAAANVDALLAHNESAIQPDLHQN